MMKKRLFRIGLVIILLVVLIVVFPRFSNVKGENPMRKQDQQVLLIAHGGGNKEFPDNTLEAFYNAYAVDPNVMMETDVSITKDSVVILSHDTTLDRKTTLTYADIIQTNYTDLVEQEVDFGYHNTVSPKSNGYNVTSVFTPYTNHLGDSVTPLDVPYPEGFLPRHESKFLVTTLEDLITAFPTNRINVEIKQSGETGLLALEAVIDLMDRLDEEYNTFSRMVLASFHKEIFSELLRIQKNDFPALMLSPAVSGVVKYYILHRLRFDLFYFDPITVLQVPTDQYGFQLDTKAFIRTAHKHNIAVHYWTINDPDVMRTLIANGADGIMTDLPTLLKSIINEMNQDNDE